MPESEALLDQIARFVERHELFSGIRRLLVGCSGGGDSVVLVDLLRALSPRYNLELVVAHLDHGWRGEESRDDALFVQRLARDRCLPFVGGIAEPAPAAGSLEQHFREQRLRFFEDTARQTGCEALALGHTLDDQAETLLMYLARGAGKRGLGGIRPRARVGELLLLRPLLGARREALREYGAAAGLAWREDSTNADPRFFRNRVRASVMPALEAALPGAVERLGRTAVLMQEEERWLVRLAAEQLEAVSIDAEGGDGLVLDLEALQRMPEPLLRRVLREALRRVRADLRGIHLEHVEAIREALVHGDQRARDVPGVRLLRQGHRLRLLPLDGRRLRNEIIC